MSDPFPLVDVVPCGGCGRSVPPRLTVCPSCHGLIHRAALESLSAQATAAEQAGDWAAAARLWRGAPPPPPPPPKTKDPPPAPGNGPPRPRRHNPPPQPRGGGGGAAPPA